MLAEAVMTPIPETEIPGVNDCQVSAGTAISEPWVSSACTSIAAMPPGLSVTLPGVGISC